MGTPVLDDGSPFQWMKNDNFSLYLMILYRPEKVIIEKLRIRTRFEKNKHNTVAEVGFFCSPSMNHLGNIYCGRFVLRSQP